jgi:putative polyhydroxyalkanoate system protein
MSEMTATIPHQLTRAEAKRRLQEKLDALRREHGSALANLHETWTGDNMAFAVNTMGQSITGQLRVDDQAVHVTVDLPVLLRLLGQTIKSKIEQQARALLEAPAPRG